MGKWTGFFFVVFVVLPSSIIWKAKRSFQLFIKDTNIENIRSRVMQRIKTYSTKSIYRKFQNTWKWKKKIKQRQRQLWNNWMETERLVRRAIGQCLFHASHSMFQSFEEYHTVSIRANARVKVSSSIYCYIASLQGECRWICYFVCLCDTTRYHNDISPDDEKKKLCFNIYSYDASSFITMLCWVWVCVVISRNSEIQRTPVAPTKPYRGNIQLTLRTWNKWVNEWPMKPSAAHHTFAAMNCPRGFETIQINSRPADLPTEYTDIRAIIFNVALNPLLPPCFSVPLYASTDWVYVLLQIFGQMWHIFVWFRLINRGWVDHKIDMTAVNDTIDGLRHTLSRAGRCFSPWRGQTHTHKKLDHT